MPSAGDSLRRTVRRRTRRATGAAAGRYRAAVLEQSRWLPVYLTAVDAADLALRTARAARRRPVPAVSWSERDPAVPTAQRAGLSATGELSVVLAGPAHWRESVGGLALAAGDDVVRLGDGLLERAAERVQLCVAVPLDRLAPGRWWVVLLDRAGTQLAGPGVARSALTSQPDRGASRLEVEGGELVLMRGPDGPNTIEHRVRTGIAQLTVEWTPPPGTPHELLLLDADGRVAHRIPASVASGPFALRAAVDAGTLGTAPTAPHDLSPAVPGPEGPMPLVLGSARYPLLSGAPGHGSARLGRARVEAGYGAGNQLRLHVRSDG